LKNRYAHLILIADPQTLGRIRPLLHKETQERLIKDLAKDFTNAPLEDIQRALS
jgi:protein required for attachment to host cells